MAVYRVDEILAKTDPFDLAQAIERHVRAMSANEIRTLISQARERAGSAYHDELGALLDPKLNEAALRSGFVRFLRGNLRAVAYFGAVFSQRVLAECPRERVVAIGEERRAPSRAVVVCATVLALIVMGAAAQHAVATARARVQVPEPLPPAVAYLPTRRQASIAAPAPRSLPAPSRRPAQAPHAAAPSQPTAPPQPETLQPDSIPVQPAPAMAPRVAVRRRRPPETRGAAVVVRVKPARPTLEPAPIDVDGMPDATTDATPLPQQSAEPVTVAARDVPIQTPKPAPKHHSWLHRAIMHLDPFKASGSN